MKQKEQYQLTKLACYISSVSMAVVSTLSPLLFVTFRELYQVSYTKLGLLVVVNFFTQMLIDLVFTFFSKHFNIHKTVRITPALTFIGLLIYGVLPPLFSGNAYLWIAIGTMLFSVAAGLNEVLLSPVIAAIPSDNPEREMSKLHSMYAWGVVAVVLISTLFLKVFGTERWYLLAVLWAVVPLVAYFLFQASPLPVMEMGQEEKKGSTGLNLGILLCTACIFFGGAAECTMTQWASDFIESALGIPKVWGDVLGVAVFAALLGLGRSLYARYGKRILNVMLLGMFGAFVCYVGSCLSIQPVQGMIFCVATGIFVSMLWPGTIICVGENFAEAGVAVYALMAAGGDLGASVGPQLVGILSDKISASGVAVRLAGEIGITAEQVGIRAGLLVSAIFPLLGMVSIVALKNYLKSKETKKVKYIQGE